MFNRFLGGLCLDQTHASGEREAKIRADMQGGGRFRQVVNVLTEQSVPA